jgi:hypothetical protein
MIHVAFDCGGVIIAKPDTYGQGLPSLEFECVRCGQIVGNIAGVSLPEKSEALGEVPVV